MELHRSEGTENVNFIADFVTYVFCMYEGWNFNSGNYLFTTDTK